MLSQNDVDFSQRDGLTGVDQQFVRRWSPRYFTSVALSNDVRDRLIEAARWAPSCYNEQPWHFYLSDAASFSDYLGLLVEGNQQWAKSTSLIGFLVVKKHFSKNNKDNQYAEFDAGAAWMSLALQARKEGWYAHGMGGIKHHEVADYLSIDTQTHKVVMGFAVGKLADLNEADEETREAERPNQRKPLTDIMTVGR